MSIECYYFLRGEKLPSVSQWQAALNEAGADIVLDDVGDLRTHTGYIPVIYRGQPSGFEWFFGPLEENYCGIAPDGIGDRAHVINCVTHSDMRELVCGLVACAVLSRLADGVFLNDESGQVISAEQALLEARKTESEVI
jgi:hypothetical protein